MAKVYLETSFFSVCVSTRSSDKVRGWRSSSNKWWQNIARYHDLFVSREVVEELSAPDFANRNAALAMLAGVQLLEISAQVADFAELMVREKVMPAPSVAGDAIHVAAASVYGMDYILTWNVKHLANPNKRRHFAVICTRLRLIPPMIVTPDMFQETDDGAS